MLGVAWFPFELIAQLPYYNQVWIQDLHIIKNSRQSKEQQKIKRTTKALICIKPLTELF